jgi:hypothetical protein
MHRVSTVRVLFAVAAIFLLTFLPGCGGGSPANNGVTAINLNPTSISLNEGTVASLSAIATNSAGGVVAADISFTSSNTSIATISSGGLICAGVWDSSIINCNATQGQAGVGQVTITATATDFPGVTATATVYVHERVDQVVAIIGNACTSMGQPVTISGKAYSTSAPGCSTGQPCDITSTVGPFAFGSNNSKIAATSAGIESTYSSSSNTPVYLSGGTISGSKDQTCNLSSFNGVTGATATVALTGSNTIANGTQLTITSAGYGATTAPTSATLSDGTATCSGTASVQTSITSGVMTAQQPGTGSLFASVSGVNSPGVPYNTCAVSSILVHSSSGSGTTFSLAAAGTQGLTADVLDTNGASIAPTLTWGSSSTATATVAVGTSGNNPATVTAVTGGTAYITATCSYPDCNIGVPPQYSQNVATVSVTPASNTTVYAGSTNSKTLVPISTDGNTAGTAITLPNTPNSIISDPAGKAVYLGSSGGLMAIAAGSTTVTAFSATGSILAISPDGAYLLMADYPNNKIVYYSITGGTVLDVLYDTIASSSAYTPDSKLNEWVTATQYGVGYPNGFLNVFDTPSAPSYMDISGQGGLTYITSASGAQIFTYSTCNQSETQAIPATSPTLIKAIPNGTGAVAVDSPSIDVISTPSTLSTGCPVTTQSTLNAYNLGVGSFTPTQLLMTTDSSMAWILSNLPSAIGFNLSTLSPTTFPITGGAIPLSGSLSLDGTQLWVGTTDNTVHRIFTNAGGDGAQVSVNLKDSNGNTTAPNLVTVLP